ncbi:VWA domain-containing protein [Clostridium perfringens]|uniref:von Willebrand factor type A/Cna B-type domain-containing protein n=1 Tax=Clostridium perfringens F262 TaxID=883064 RepID=A0AAV3FF70_CLOPF|nr:vWA domain-containing protein [Clostridium perfringens]EIA18031.1 von Willebrand factor type A/Cna B-type domain-containing protein [Clostridium perfringens F262]ELC8367152.1 VWA domain-containing protein [Clostridium perfringens]MBO3343386.1 VWA domain-containing protein [Clostridium perfringens]MBO3346458.1 VWA domain-containing protein [Clostridium perfringens]MBO3349530.1 VWA domain-containing protein [Clostridium perfringens]
MNSKGIGTKKLTSIISLIMTVVFLSILLPTNLIKAEEKSDSMSVEKVLDSEMYNKFNNEILNNESSIKYTTDNNKGTWPVNWEYGNVSNKNKINKSVYGKNQPLEYNEGYLTKKAYTTDEDNVFNINLKIQGKKNEALKKDVVFLLDNSNSMLTNNRALKIKEEIKNVMDKLKAKNTRYALVTYASTILDGRHYHLIDRSIGNNQYTVYDLYTSNQCHLNFTSNIQEIYNKIPSTVPNQRNNPYAGGTFTQEGLLKAIELLKNSNADEKIIIHLTDGLPTFSFLLKEFGGNKKAIFDYNTNYNGIGVRGLGTSYFFDTKTQKPYIYSREEVYSALNRSKNKYESIWNNGFPTTLEAENIKNENPDINIYTIGVELKKEVYKWDDYRQYYNAEGTVELPEIRKFLESISSSPAEAFVNENVDDIDEIINKIIDKINKSINNGTVIDPMGDMVDIIKSGEFSDKDYKLTASNNKLLEGVKVGYNEKNRQIVLTGLNLGENEWVELNYKVRLNTSNPDFNGDFWYQANKRTVLNPNNKEPNVFRDFVIPSVTGKRPSIEVKLKKISSETSKPLANSEFELYNSINEKLGSFTTKENGEVSLGYLQEGDYKLKEINPPKGYILSKDFINFKVKNGKAIQDGNEVEFITVSNTPNSIRIKKTDDSKLESDAKFLSGAKFELNKVNDQKFKPLVKETDDKGEIEFKEIEPGTYYLKEVLAPNGYEQIKEDIGPIVVDNTGVVTIPWDKLKSNDVEKWNNQEIIRIKNKKLKSAIYIDKVDAINPEIKLSGAKFSLYTNDENYKNNKKLVRNGINYYLISEKLSNDKGRLEWENLNSGEEYKYLIQETEAPKGYTVSGKEILFHFKDNNVVIDNDKDVQALANVNGQTIFIKNAKIYKLPSSGGIGVYPFLLIGTILITLSLSFYFKSKALNKKI